MILCNQNESLPKVRKNRIPKKRIHQPQPHSDMSQLNGSRDELAQAQMDLESTLVRMDDELSMFDSEVDEIYTAMESIFAVHQDIRRLYSDLIARHATTIQRIYRGYMVRTMLTLRCAAEASTVVTRFIVRAAYLQRTARRNTSRAAAAVSTPSVAIATVANLFSLSLDDYL